MMTLHFRRCFCLAAALFWLAPAFARAEFSQDMVINTSGLTPGATYFVDMILIDGGTTGNNAVTLSNVRDLGGTILTPPTTLIGGASGDLTGTATLSDTTFFNEFTQGFTAGAQLTFTLRTTTNNDDPVPDSFTLSVLDRGGSPLATNSPPPGSDDLIAFDISSTLTPAGIEYYSGTSPAISAGPKVVPEPNTLALLCLGLAGLAGARLRSRRAHDRPISPWPW